MYPQIEFGEFGSGEFILFVVVELELCGVGGGGEFEEKWKCERVSRMSSRKS